MLQIVKAGSSTFEDTLQASNFNSNNGQKSALCKVVKQAQGEVVWSSRASTVYKVDMPSLAQTKPVAARSAIQYCPTRDS